MARTTVTDTVVVVDDEPHNVLWMADYLDAKGLSFILATNLNDAVQEINKEIYRALVIDLNIPVIEPLDAAVAALGAVYARYPGLYAARQARNQGYRGKQVVIYSVHKDAGVAEEAKKLGCTYILKGRPREVKAELDDIVQYDPTLID
jgi:CheY-like chemotaxis protein